MRAETLTDAAREAAPFIGDTGNALDDLKRAMASGAGNMAQNTAIAAAIEAHQQAAALRDTVEKVSALFARRDQLQAEGYAPLMRFGQHYLSIYRMDPLSGDYELDENGEKVMEYFGLFESAAERDKAEQAFREQYEGDSGVEFDVGTLSEDEWKLYKGVSPESVEIGRAHV